MRKSPAGAGDGDLRMTVIAWEGAIRKSKTLRLFFDAAYKRPELQVAVIAASAVARRQARSQPPECSRELRPPQEHLRALPRYRE